VSRLTEGPDHCQESCDDGKEVPHWLLLRSELRM
jgi:hypothetical protein